MTCRGAAGDSLECQHRPDDAGVSSACLLDRFEAAKRPPAPALSADLLPPGAAAHAASTTPTYSAGGPLYIGTCAFLPDSATQPRRQPCAADLAAAIGACTLHALAQTAGRASPVMSRGGRSRRGKRRAALGRRQFRADRWPMARPAGPNLRSAVPPSSRWFMTSPPGGCFSRARRCPMAGGGELWIVSNQTTWAITPSLGGSAGLSSTAANQFVILEKW